MGSGPHTLASPGLELQSLEVTFMSCSTMVILLPLLLKVKERCCCLGCLSNVVLEVDSVGAVQGTGALVLVVLGFTVVALILGFESKGLT